MATSSITLEFVALARKAQLSAVVAMAFEMQPQLSNAKFKVSEYARTVVLDSMDAISEKTATNYASVAKSLCTKYGVKISDLEFTVDNVLMFANFLTAELGKFGYSCAVDDMQAYCSGKPSMKAKREAAAQAEAEAKERQAKAEADKVLAEKSAAEKIAEAAAKQAQDAEAAKQQAEAAAAAAQAEAAKQAQEKQDAEARAQAIAREAQAKQAAAEAEAAAAKAEAAAQAEEQRKFNESVCIQVRVNADGSANIDLANNMSPEFLGQVIKALQAEQKRLKASILKAA